MESNSHPLCTIAQSEFGIPTKHGLPVTDFFSRYTPDACVVLSITALKEDRGNYYTDNASKLLQHCTEALALGPFASNLIECALQVLALYHAPFKEVLLLDADCLPLVSPENLFMSPAYKEHGTHFWPDFWSGHDEQISQVLKINEPDMQQQTESGQIIFHRSVSITNFMLLQSVRAHMQGCLILPI